MEKQISAHEFLDLIGPRDFPDRRQVVIPGVNELEIKWDDKAGAMLGPDAAGKWWPMTFEAYSQLGYLVGINAALLRRAPPAETTNVVNYRLNLPSQPHMLYSVKDDVIVQWTKGGTQPETNTSIIHLIASALHSGLSDLLVTYFTDTIDQTRFHVVATNQAETVNGDPVALGIAVLNSLAWTSPLQLAAYTYHLDNGDGAIAGRMFTQHTRRRTLDRQEQWIIQSLEQIKKMDALRIKHMQELAEFDTSKPGAQAAVLKSIFNDFRAPKESRRTLYELAMAKPPQTMYDVYRIVSHMGSNLDDHHWLTDKARYKVLELAGNLVSFTERCHSCYRGSLPHVPN